MGFPKFEISTDGVITTIKCDGKVVKGVRAFALSQKAGEIPILTLDLNATDLSVDGTMLPELPEVFRPFYEEIRQEE